MTTTTYAAIYAGNVTLTWSRCRAFECGVKGVVLPAPMCQAHWERLPLDLRLKIERLSPFDTAEGIWAWREALTEAKSWLVNNPT